MRTIKQILRGDFPGEDVESGFKCECGTRYDGYKCPNCKKERERYVF